MLASPARPFADSSLFSLSKKNKKAKKAVKTTFYIFNFAEKRQFRLSGWKRGTPGTGGCHDIKYSFDALKRSNILAAEGEVAFFVCPGENFATERLPD